MLKAEHIGYLRIYINSSCICESNTANHFNFSLRLL